MTDEQIINLAKQVTGWTTHFAIPQEPLGHFYAGPHHQASVDNIVRFARALLAQPDHSGDEGAGHCSEGDRCVCGGDLPRVREGCANWRAGTQATAPQDGDERVRFEAYMTSKGYVCKTHLGAYVAGDVASKWDAWQAALAQKAVPVAVEPIGYFINDAAEGMKPHYSQIDEAFRSNKDVFELYRSPAPIASAEEAVLTNHERIELYELRAALESISESQPVGYLAAYEIERLNSGHDANLRSAKFGPILLDGDVPVYTHPAAAQPSGAEVLTDAARDVLAERQRQITEKGHTVDDDAIYNDQGQMSYAAAGLAVLASEAATDIVCGLTGGLTYADECIGKPEPWPHDWKYKPATPRRNLVVAAAFILAEIERIDYVTEAP